MKHKIWGFTAFFICCWLVFVARHHPRSRRKIKEIWHGRVFWQSNTTMLRSSTNVTKTTVASTDAVSAPVHPFPQVYIITMDEVPERVTHMNMLIKSHPLLSVKKWPAVTPSKFQNPDYLKYTNAKTFQKVRAGAVGCALSHISLLYFMLEQQFEDMIVFEDDVELSNTFEEDFLEFKKHLPEDFDFGQLLHHKHMKEQRHQPKYKLNNYVIKSYRPYGTVGYYITAKGARKVLPTLTPIWYPIDEMFRSAINKKIVKSYMPVNDLVTMSYKFKSNIWSTTIKPLEQLTSKTTNLPKICKHFPFIWKDKLKSDMLELLRFAHEMFEELGIDYVIHSGTALAYIRHNKTQIPWDDDIDLYIRKKDTTKVKNYIDKSSVYCHASLWLGFKIFKCDSPKIGQYKWSYPMIDIFTTTNKWNTDKLLWPSKLSEFENQPVRIPADINAHLVAKYGPSYLESCHARTWDHKNEKNTVFSGKLPCKDLVKKCGSQWPKTYNKIISSEVVDKYGTIHLKVKKEKELSDKDMNVHMVWVTPFLHGESKLSNGIQDCLYRWKEIYSNTILWTNDKVRKEFPELVDMLARIPVSSWSSNILRYAILKKYGGLYVDTDVLPYRSIAPLVEKHRNGFFVCEEPRNRLPCKVLATAVLYLPQNSNKYNPLLQKAMSESERILSDINYETFKYDGKNRVTGPSLPTKMFHQNLFDEIDVVSSQSFFPCDWSDRSKCVYEKFKNDESVFGIHLWKKRWKVSRKFHADTLKLRKKSDRMQYDDAFSSGKWVDSPNKKPYYANGNCIQHGDKRKPWQKTWKPFKVNFEPIKISVLNSCVHNTIFFIGDSHIEQQGYAMQNYCKAHECSFKIRVKKDYYLLSDKSLKTFMKTRVHSALKPSKTLLTILNSAKKDDILVLGTGHHYSKGHGITDVLSWDEMKLLAKNAIQMILNELRSTFKGILIWQSYSPRHFKGGEWDSNGKCDNNELFTKSVVSENELDYLKLWGGMLDVVSRFDFGYPIIINNITDMTLQRPDAHVTKFNNNRKMDCSHYCYPGVTDEWNTMWYNQLCIGKVSSATAIAATAIDKGTKGTIMTLCTSDYKDRAFKLSKHLTFWGYTLYIVPIDWEPTNIESFMYNFITTPTKPSKFEGKKNILLFKVSAIEEMLRKIPENTQLLWLDADIAVLKNPSEIISKHISNKCDISTIIRDSSYIQGKLALGAIVLSNNQNTRTVLKSAMDSLQNGCCSVIHKKIPWFQDQISIYKAIQKHPKTNLCGLADNEHLVGRPHGGFEHKPSVDSSIVLYSGKPLPKEVVQIQEKTYNPHVYCVLPVINNLDSINMVRNTWGSKCDKLFFCASEKIEIILNEKTEVIHLNDVLKASDNKHEDMFDKLKKCFRTIVIPKNENVWVLKADLDTNVNIPNLKAYIETLHPKRAFIGNRLKEPLTGTIFNSGGAGFVLSADVVKQFVSSRNEKCMAEKNMSPKWSGKKRSKQGKFCDVRVAICLGSLEVYPQDTTDETGAERFHPFSPSKMKSLWKDKSSWYWTHKYDKSTLYTKNLVSEKSISFHRLEKAVKLDITEWCKTHNVLPNGAFCSKKYAGMDKNLAPALLKVLGNTIGDFGAGGGWYTDFFNKNGRQSSAYDASPTRGNMVTFMDLTEPSQFEDVYDSVLCLEVGEHIPNEKSDILLSNIVKHAKTSIVLSWAIPGQGGNGHINCQTNKWVIDKMNKLGWAFDDKKSHMLRNAAKFHWFKNTILVFFRQKKNKKETLNHRHNTCKWQKELPPLQINCNEGKNTKICKLYDAVSTIYSWNNNIGYGVHKHLIGPILQGGALTLFRDGTFNWGVHDSDIDLAYAAPTLKKKIKAMHRAISVFKREIDQTKPLFNYTCECLLPNNKYALCLSDAIEYSRLNYGPSWWIPNLSMKKTMLYGEIDWNKPHRPETIKKWVTPLRKDILKYDKDKNGIITTDEIEVPHRLRHMVTDFDIYTSIEQLNKILSTDNPVKFGYKHAIIIGENKKLVNTLDKQKVRTFTLERFPNKKLSLRHAIEFLAAFFTGSDAQPQLDGDFYILFNTTKDVELKKYNRDYVMINSDAFYVNKKGILYILEKYDTENAMGLVNMFGERRNIYITANLVGGLANNMWIYQSVHGIAKHNDMVPVFNKKSYGYKALQDMFVLDDQSINDMEFTHKTTYDDMCYKNGECELPNLQESTKIGKYLQTMHFFRPMGKTLKDFYTIKAKHKQDALELIKNTDACIHVRIFPESHLKMGNNICPTMDKVIDIVTKFTNQMKRIKIFSNDLDFIKKYIHANSWVSFADSDASETTKYRDFAALTMCDDLIVTCGTFSGMAAALHSGNGDVYYFNDPWFETTYGKEFISHWRPISKLTEDLVP